MHEREKVLFLIKLQGLVFERLQVKGTNEELSSLTGPPPPPGSIIEGILISFICEKLLMKEKKDRKIKMLIFKYLRKVFFIQYFFEGEKTVK